MAERSPGQFRKGESESKPWGGKIADTSFAQALSSLARARGFESRASLGKALGRKEAKAASVCIEKWYKGKRIPSPESMGSLLTILKPNDAELDSIIEPWRKGLRESMLRRSKGRAKKTETSPLLGWLGETAQRKQLTRRELLQQLEIPRGLLGLPAYFKILENGPIILNLSEPETLELGDIVGKTISKEVESGHRHQPKISGRKLLKIQSGLHCETLKGQQAAASLGISRERVRQLREKYSLPYLLTDRDISFLKERREQNTRKKRV